MSTEFTLLKVSGDKDDLAAVNIELSVTESGTRFSIDLFKTHPTISEAFDHQEIVNRLSSEELEHLAVRILYIASIQSNHDVEFLRKYNLPLHGPMNTALEL